MKIFCDLDGTLVDVSKRHYIVYSEVTNELGGKPLSSEEYWTLKRSKAEWGKILPLSMLNLTYESAFLDKFIAKIEHPNYLRIDELFPDSLPVLDWLNQIGDCYLVSLRRNRMNLLGQLDDLKINTCFKEILTGHSETDGYDVKIRLIKSRLENDKGFIIGDTEADVVTGKQLGISTIAVQSGIRDRTFLASLSPDYLVDSISQVRQIINGAGK